MKKLFTLISIPFLVTAAQAQDFVVTPSTANVSGSAENFELVAYGKLYNVQGDSTFTWLIIENQATSGWTTQMCDKINCWDPGVTTNVISVPEGDSSILDLHFLPDQIAGNGQVKVIVWAGSDTANSDTIEYFADAWPMANTKISNDRNLRVYPNPSSGKLTLDYQVNGTVQVEIYDVLGKKLKTFTHTGQSSTFDISDLPDGLYVIRVIEGGKVVSRSFRKA